MQFRTTLVSLAALLAFSAASSPMGIAKKSSPPKVVTLPDGLKYVDLTVGKGASPKAGQMVVVTYVGKLVNGTKFDASSDHGDGTFSFGLGQGQVIKGWDEGVATMRVGGYRRLTVPPALGYGDQGAGGVIPPNATLVFDIKLLRIQ
jgi:peptidylprolyl isomerase